MKPDNILTTTYLEKHPENAARVLESLPYSMTAELLEQLSPTKYLNVFNYLLPSYAANIVDMLQDEYRGKLVNTLSTEKLVLLMPFFTDIQRNSLLAQLPSDGRKNIIRQMQYPMDTVGKIMSPPTFSLPGDITVTEALKRIKNSRKKYFPVVFVLDRSLHYIGMVSLDVLIRSVPGRKLSSIMDSSIPALHTRKSLLNLINDPAWSSIHVLPVTDSKGIFTGVLEYSVLQRHIKMENFLERPQKKNLAAPLELVIHTLAVLTKGLIYAMFSSEKTTKPRGKNHDITS